MAEALTFRETWSNWLEQELDGHQLLWGVEILWWGRIGAVLQLIAAATIVAEIVGTERLRRLGAAMERHRIVVLPKHLFKGALEWRRSGWMVPEASATSTENGDATVWARRVEVLNWVVSVFFALGFSAALVASPEMGLVPAIIFFPLLVGAFLFTGGPFTVMVLAFLFYVFGSLPNWLVIRPLAWLLAQKNLQAIVKLGSLLLLLGGFGLEMLAS